MCMSTGENELDMVRGLMDMTLRAVVADTLNVELDKVVDEARLVGDLAPNETLLAQLLVKVSELFEHVSLNLPHGATFGHLLEQVVGSAFEDTALPA